MSYICTFSPISLLYTSPRLLEISTNGRVNVDISDDPLYNKVSFYLLRFIILNNVPKLDLQTVSGTNIYRGPPIIGTRYFQHKGVPQHKDEQNEVGLPNMVMGGKWEYLYSKPKSKRRIVSWIPQFNF